MNIGLLKSIALFTITRYCIQGRLYNIGDGFSINGFSIA
jgi:hypothetical protein